MLVDVVEGVCTQTIHVLRQAWKDRLVPVLVLNKMDRLFSELHLSPSEAYFHLVGVVEAVNGVMSRLHAHELVERDSARYEKSKTGGTLDGEADAAATPWVMEELDEERIFFSPEKGNVLFASAFQGWGFR